MTDTNPMTQVQALDALTHERFQSIVDQGTALEYALVQAKYALGEVSAQETLRALKEIAATSPLSEDILSLALRLGLEASFAMRSRVRAESWLTTCESQGLTGALMTEAKVEIALAFDDREEAERLLANATVSLKTRYVQARFAYVKGNFETVQTLLGPLLSRDRFDVEQLRAWRLAAEAYAGSRNFSEEAELLERVVQALPDGIRTGRERLELASAYAAIGGEEALEHAEKHLRVLAQGDPEEGIVGYANRRLEYLDKARAEEAQDKPRHARLAFPTVHQKRNYCGPAVLELCLRSLGIELGQDEIAGVVKREDGTPMYEIVAFLEERDIEARRMVANLDRLRSAIDLGLPVILQEEYSTTAHVAVVTGYDDRLGLFVCQDPMTHRAQLKSYEWVQNSGQLFGNGVVVVVGRRSEITEERREQLASAEIVSHDAFGILDEADRMRASAQGEQESAVVHEVLIACEKALAADSKYQLAWYRRAWAELARYRNDRSMRRNAQRSVHMSRVTWRGAEWPHQLHASMLEHEGRWREAYVEHLSAHRCDPADGENLASMSHCQGVLGDVQEGIDNGHQALRVLPAHSWIAAELAVQYTQVLESRSSGKWPDSSELPWLHVESERPCKQTVQWNDSEIDARLSFYTELAREQQPENLSILLTWCLQSALKNDFNEACTRFREALKMHENHPRLLVRLARASLLAGDREGAQAATTQLTKSHASEYRSWLAAAEVSREDAEQTWKHLIRGVKEVGPDRSELVDALYDAGRKWGGGTEAAAVLLSELSEEFSGDARFVRLLADQIDRVGQRGLAVQLYRRVVESEEGDLNSRYRLATLLADDPLTQEEGRDRLAEVLRMAPSATVVRIKLAWCLLESPEAGLDVLAQAMDEGNPRVYETATHLLRNLGQDEQATQMRTQALGNFATEDDARAELGAWHYYSDRYDRAIELLAPLTTREFAGTGDLEEVQDTILTAYRLAGRVHEIADWVKELCKDEVPGHLAFEVYWAFRSFDNRLAACAARVQANNAATPSAALEYEANAASCDTRSDDMEPLQKVIARLEEGAGLEDDAKLDAWETVYHAFAKLRKISDAESALGKMRELRPDARATLATEQDFASLCGKREAAMSAALKLRELYPYQHMGDERLGILYGIAGDAENAVRHATRALSIAPYCHISHNSGAMAYFAAGDIEKSILHMERSEALDKSEMPLRWSAYTALMHALRGDVESFEACLEDRKQMMDGNPYADYEKRLRELLATRV